MAPFEFDTGGGYFAPFVIRRIDEITTDIIRVSLHSDPQQRADQVKKELSSRIGQEVLVFDSKHKRRFGGVVRYNSDNPEEMYQLEIAPHTFFPLNYIMVVSLSYFKGKD